MNDAMSVIKHPPAPGPVPVVCGVNLPMLLKLVSLRSAGKPIAQLAREVAEAGQKAIGHASELLRGRMG